jgi:hypothetical protein
MRSNVGYVGWSLALVVASVSIARADVRAGLRLGAEPLALQPNQDTPILGGYLDDAVDAYNAAATMYNQAHGYAAGSPNASAPVDRSQLGLRTTLALLEPGIEVGGKHAAVRLEAVLGFARDYRAYGIGIYPIDLSLPMDHGTFAPYLVAGGTASWLARTDVDGEVGALVSVRVAVGVRIHRVTVELGYHVRAAGGVVDSTTLRSMALYDPTGSAPPPPADRVVSGGEQSGMIDVSMGLSL